MELFQVPVTVVEETEYRWNVLVFADDSAKADETVARAIELFGDDFVKYFKQSDAMKEYTHQTELEIGEIKKVFHDGT